MEPDFSVIFGAKDMLNHCRFHSEWVAGYSPHNFSIHYNARLSLQKVDIRYLPIFIFHATTRELTGNSFYHMANELALQNQQPG